MADVTARVLDKPPIPTDSAALTSTMEDASREKRNNDDNSSTEQRLSSETQLDPRLVAKARLKCVAHTQDCGHDLTNAGLTFRFLLFFSLDFSSFNLTA
jgi:hypothetical protein